MSSIPSKPNILILAGEASGDLLASSLCVAIQKRLPNAIFFGMGGTKMQKVGVELLVNADEMAVVGGWEILSHWPAIRNAFRRLKQAIIHRRPDLVILVDYPGFNLRMAKFAKQAGCKVLFYVSPQIWAWRYRRIFYIKRYVDHMAVLFSFEKALYEKEQVPVTFVGHPLTDTTQASDNINTIYSRYELNPSHPIIALFPGSRQQEISRMLPTMIAAAERVQHQLPQAQFVLPLASSLSADQLTPMLPPSIRVIEHDTYNLLSICTAAMAVSGTVTLEIALHQVPFVILYRMSPLSFWLAKHLIRLSYIGLCNIVAETLIAKELLQKDATPQNIAEEVIELVQNTNYRKSIIKKCLKVKDNLGEGGASDRAAEVAINILDA